MYIYIEPQWNCEDVSHRLIEMHINVYIHTCIYIKPRWNCEDVSHRLMEGYLCMCVCVVSHAINVAITPVIHLDTQVSACVLITSELCVWLIASLRMCSHNF